MGDARAAIEWYVEVLGAEVVFDPIIMDDGHVGHVELAANGARWMMSEVFESADVAAPAADRGSAVTLHLTVADVDTLATAVEASGTAMAWGPKSPHMAKSRSSSTPSVTAGCSTSRPAERSQAAWSAQTREALTAAGR